MSDDNTEDLSGAGNKQTSAPRASKKKGMELFLVELIDSLGVFWAMRVDDDDDKPRTIMELSKDNVVSVKSVKYLAGIVCDRVKHLKNNGREIDFSFCMKAVDRWSWSTKKILRDWPVSVAFKSETQRITFCRLAFDPEPCTVDEFHESCPTLSYVLKRMTNAAAFCHRVAAMYDGAAARKQAVWVHGPTDGGKSKVADFLSELAGGNKAVADLAAEDLSGAHWKYPLVGKSLVILRECPNVFLTTDRFKNLTGDRWHLINRKGRDQFSVQLQSLVFAFSNAMPLIPTPEVKNRLVVCYLESVAPERLISEDEFMRLCRLEAPKFIGLCRTLYDQSGRKTAVNDDEALSVMNSLATDSDWELQEAFDRFFAHQEGAKAVLSSQFIAAIAKVESKAVTAYAMREFVKRRYKSDVGHRVGQLRYVTNIRLLSAKERLAAGLPAYIP